MSSGVFEHLLSVESADLGDFSQVDVTPQSQVRPWPPAMIRDVFNHGETTCRSISPALSMSHVVDFLSASEANVVAVYSDADTLLGIAVDDDVMALIKRDGVAALDYSASEAVQRGRPVVSMTDSPFVVLGMMRDHKWDRVGVSERGRVVGVLYRRDLVKFVET